VRWSLLTLAALVVTLLGAEPLPAEDLGIVRVVTRPKAGQPLGQFTAAHLGSGVLLTCGHCCKAAGGIDAIVNVEILSAADRKPYRTVAASVVCYNETADVGVLRFEQPDALQTTCALAPRDYDLEVGTPVLLYTWQPGGRQLRSVPSVITKLNLFAGPANIETRQAPVVGDSGAPLVLRGDRLVIGVTTGADYWNRFGVHAGLDAIHDVLAQCPVRVPVTTIQTAAGAASNDNGAARR